MRESKGPAVSKASSVRTPARRALDDSKAHMATAIARRGGPEIQRGVRVSLASQGVGGERTLEQNFDRIAEGRPGALRVATVVLLPIGAYQNSGGNKKKSGKHKGRPIASRRRDGAVAEDAARARDESVAERRPAKQLA